VGCALITKGVVAFGELSRFGHVGHGGRPWLVGWDGGGGERGSGDGWLAQEGWLQQVFKLAQDLHVSSPPPTSNH
jgi:hypothetical protein